MNEVDFFDDKTWLPVDSQEELLDQPYYQGHGNLDGIQLELLCERFTEYCHQQEIIKQSLMRATNELMVRLKRIQKELEK